MTNANKGINLRVKLILFLLVLFLAVGVHAAEVSVYAEGAYADSDLVVLIYADAGSNELRSFGVKLTYDDTKLSVSSAERNDIWSLGDDSSYAAPDTNTSGEVIMIGGILDTENPAAGIPGERVLLGTVTFERLTSANPPVPTEAELFFGIQVLEGHASPFADVVDVNGAVLDSSDLFTGTTIRERGDANGDGLVNFQDMLTVKYYTQHGGDDTPYADCNADGLINFQDMLCIKSKTQ